MKIGKKIKRLFSETKDVVDVDWFTEDDQWQYHFEVDKDKAMRFGITTAQVAANMNAALSGQVSRNTAPAVFIQPGDLSNCN